MSIEILEEWNDRLSYCGCCEMPVCPTFEVVRSTKTGRGDRCSQDMWDEINDDPPPSCANARGTWSSRVRLETRTEPDEPTRWSEYTYTATRSGALEACSSAFTYAESEEGGVENYQAFATRISRSWSGGVVTEVWEWLDEGPDPDVTVTYTIVETWSGYLSEADSLLATLSNATLVLDASSWGSESVGVGFPLSKYVPTFNDYLTAACPDGGYVITAIDLYAARFKIRIPTTHTGSKYTITYDIGEFPDDGDPSFVSQDNVIEWAGPGTGVQSDPSWLTTDWIEIDPPDVAGERRIVNARYTCYTGTKFGSKPQVMGESLEIPPP